MKQLPMMATGKVISDYRPLIKYLEIADKESKDKVIPRAEDIEVVRELISRGISNLNELLNELIKYVQSRVNEDLAKKAVEEVFNTEVDKTLAKHIISKVVAGWIIEMAEQFGVIKFKFRY